MPSLALYEIHMKAKGKLTGDYLLAQTVGSDQCLAPTYYDGSSVFRQIGGKYPAEATWPPYQAKSEACYRDSYVVRNNGSVPGYWGFSDGMRRDFDETGDQASKSAIHLLAINAAYCTDVTPLAWVTSAMRSREVAYCLMHRINDEQLGAPHSLRTDELLTAALGHIDQWLAYQAIAPTSDFDGAPECMGKNYFQPFMAALTMKALIQWQAWKPDARIPPAVKSMVDFLQAQAFVPGSNTHFYENCTEPGGGPWIRTKTGAPDLALLIVPTYGWMYHATGDVSYRTNGDLIWDAGVKLAYLDQGKQFNQNYWWSGRYIEWHDAAPVPLRIARVRESAAKVKAVPVPKDAPKSTTKALPEKP